MQTLIHTCPGCQGKLVITALTCPDCGLELRGQFEADNTAMETVLPQEDAQFLKVFLENRGNMSQVQEQLDISYPTAKRRLDQALKSLGIYNEEEKKEEKKMVDVRNWRVDENSAAASEIIKRKLKEQGGRATVKLLTGTEYEIWVEPGGERFASNGLGSVTVEFSIFDVVENYLKRHGGVARKGCARDRLGTKNCGLDTLAGAILQEHYGVPIGGTGFDPSFVVYAVMEWAGLVKNARGKLILKR